MGGINLVGWPGPRIASSVNLFPTREGERKRGEGDDGLEGNVICLCDCVSTSTIPTEPRKPTWYRYRTILMSSLVLNETAFITAVTKQPKVMLTPTPQQQMIYEAVGKLNFSAEEQQELFQWILSEKRKMKAKTKAEKGQIDAEKALLKEFIKGKKAFDV
ncbi:hypothetical protein KP509_28G038400 [Ceratopteris richardii]|uniref:Uncharacterized protein n=1 Tax=Ceratopteris richardii TaxID=49495 RepID=A0A8T2RDW8_CERRI|nr:hypothetical protein KP509_28G038400 [Ceratopteris richardii]